MERGRRDFLKAVGASAAGVLLSGCSSVETGGKIACGEKFPRRTFGRTGERVSIIAFGGIVVTDAEPAHAAKVVAEAVEKGINYFDVAPQYGDAQEKLGPALKPYRDGVFLACKTLRRDREGAVQELHDSLKKLETDRFDLYQLHAITDVEKDVKAALAKGGAMEAILEARKQGLIRYIGFSAHSPQAALAAMREFDFDTIMYPVSFVCHYNSGFEVEVLAEAKKRNMGIIGIKAMAKQRWQGQKDERWPKCWYEPISEHELARKSLSWTLAQGAAVAIPPGEEKLWRLAVEVAPDCKKPTRDELSELEQIATACEPIFSTGRG
ncbi:MAG: aldo/keto reductase [Planctomycetota bacterium]|jgi:aryl-alcohol dehydrogenase-like predicted oxidoreductase